MGDRPWITTALAPEIKALPTMLSEEECQYLQWVTANQFEGWGAVVDLGPWFGSSTAALAEGLRQGGHNSVVQSYDLFEWDAYMGASADLDLAPGADFRPEFLRTTEHWRDLIEAHKSDLLETTWEGGPIEILFVDAAKSWSLLRSILATFGPALEPGRSRVVLQDFRHFDCSFLPLVFDGHPQIWKPVEAVAEGTTAIFSPRVRLGRDSIQALELSEDSYPFPRAQQILGDRIRAETGGCRFRLRLTLWYLAEVGGVPHEARKLARLVCRGDPPNDEAARQRSRHHRRALRSARRARRGRLRARALARIDEVLNDNDAHWTDRTMALVLRAHVIADTGHDLDALWQLSLGLLVAYDNPPRVRGWPDLRHTRLTRPEARRALRRVKRQIAINGDTAEALCLLGEIHRASGHPGQARQDFSAALEHDPTSELARGAVESLDIASAYAALDRTLKWHWRPWVRSRDHGLDDTLRLVDQVAARNHETVDTWFLRGRVAQERGDIDTAVAAFRAALDQDPKHRWSREFLDELVHS